MKNQLDISAKKANSKASSKKTKEEKKEEYIIERDPVEGTPFTIITKEGKSFVTLGNTKLTQDYETKEEALDRVQNEDWYFKCAVISAITEVTIEELNKRINKN